MKIGVIVAAVAVVLSAGLWCQAQESREVPRGAPERQPATRAAARGDLAQIAEVCGLTEEQQKKLQEIQDGRQKAMMELQAKFQAQVMELLTPEQQAKWVGAQFLTMVQRALGKDTLSEDQLKQVKTYIAEQAKTADLSNERGRGELMQKVMTYVRTDVLTDEQREAIHNNPERRDPARREPAPPRE